MLPPTNNNNSNKNRTNTKKRILCLGSPETCGAVVECASLLGFGADFTHSFQSVSRHALQTETYEILVTELESPDGEKLFDGNTLRRHDGTIRETSTFLQRCLSKYPTMLRVVWSDLALPGSSIRKACFDCGADAVISSYECLFETLFGLLTPATIREIPTTASSMPVKARRTLTNYRPIHRRALREAQLIQLAAGSRTRRVEKLIRKTEKLEDEVLAVPQTFIQDRVSNLGPSSSVAIQKKYHPHPDSISDIDSIRLVHVSDTLNLHRNIVVPEEGGDLFVHSGNFTDGSLYNSQDQFQDFLDWLGERVCPNFEQVVFIAGNNDTLLDKLHSSNPAACLLARRTLQNFLDKYPNAAYLENSGIVFRGLKIYGTPTALFEEDNHDDHSDAAVEQKQPSRKLSFLGPKHRMRLSIHHRDAFQRPLDEHRHQVEETEGIDILVTNRPSSKLAGSQNYQLPLDALYKDVVIQPLADAFEREESDDMENRLKAGRDSKKAESSKDGRKGRKFRGGWRRHRNHSPDPVKEAPMLHASGFDGKRFGIDFVGDNKDNGTIILNASQERHLRYDKYGGGTALVIDLPSRR